MPPRYTLFLKTEILTGYLGGSTFALRKLLSVYHASKEFSEIIFFRTPQNKFQRSTCTASKSLAVDTGCKLNKHKSLIFD